MSSSFSPKRIAISFIASRYRGEAVVTSIALDGGDWARGIIRARQEALDSVIQPVLGQPKFLGHSGGGRVDGLLGLENGVDVPRDAPGRVRERHRRAADDEDLRSHPLAGQLLAEGLERMQNPCLCELTLRHGRTPPGP
jgi:hypothetical protein